MTQKLLTISILVSGRAETTEKCLSSLTPIMDAIDTELILVDTGCGRELRKKLERYATKVIDFTWCNDFSKARNAGLAEASGEWFLYLDDDEWFTDVDDIIYFFKSGEYKEYTSASYIQRNYLDMQRSQYTDSRVGRMAQITPELHFQSKIHEYLTPTGSRHKNLNAVVDHYGYVYATEEDKWAHFRRNKTLLNEMIKEEPDKLRWRLQLLQEYRSVNDYAKMEELGAAGIAMINRLTGLDDTEMRVYIGSFYAARILAADGLGDYARICALCEEAAKDQRNTKLCQTFLDEMRAKAYFYRGLYAKEDAYAQKQFAESEKYAQAYIESKEYYRVNQEKLFGQQVAPFVGECLDLVKQKEIYSIRICNGLKLNQTQNLMKYVEQLHWNEQHVYVFEEIAGILIESMNRFAESNKDRMLPTDGDYAAYEKTLRIMQRQHALWEYFCGEIEARQNSGEDMSGIVDLIGRIFPEEVGQQKQTDEMNRLIAQVKEQLCLLIENGMKEQAMRVVDQLRGMIPQDGQLLELEQMCRTDEDKK